MIQLKVNNWDKFQIRKDVKSSSWFRFDHSFFIDHKFFSLSNDEKIVWINILCSASIESKEVINYNIELAARLTNVSTKKINDALVKLEEIQCVTLQTRPRDECVPDACLQTDKQTDRQTGKNIHSDLLDLWNRNAVSHGMPKIKTISAARKKKLDEALRVFPDLDDWKGIFTIASTKGFIKKDSTPFVPSWDYIFRNENYIKFSEEHDLTASGDNIPKTNDSVVKDVENILFTQIG